MENGCGVMLGHSEACARLMPIVFLSRDPIDVSLSALESRRHPNDTRIDRGARVVTRQSGR